MLTWGYTPAVAMRMVPGKRFAKQKAHAFHAELECPNSSLCGVIVLQCKNSLVADKGARSRCKTCEVMAARFAVGRPS